jgi:hypothetical protein
MVRVPLETPPSERRWWWLAALPGGALLAGFVHVRRSRTSATGRQAA